MVKLLSSVFEKLERDLVLPTSLTILRMRLSDADAVSSNADDFMLGTQEGASINEDSSWYSLRDRGSRCECGDRSSPKGVDTLGPWDARGSNADSTTRTGLTRGRASDSSLESTTE